MNAPVLGGVRAFLALEIEAAFRSTLAALQVELTGVANGARFVRTEGIHLTLRFLGNSSPTQLESVGRGVLPLAASCPPDMAPVTGLGVFPPRGGRGCSGLASVCPPPFVSSSRGPRGSPLPAASPPNGGSSNPT